MKVKCKHCGEEFTLSEDDKELFDEGHIECPDTCTDCIEEMSDYFRGYQPETFDGDIGL